MLLNEPQQRRLEVTLSLVEQQILKLQACYLSGTIVDGEMLCIENDLTEAETEELTHLIEQMRCQIRHLRRQFQLQPRQHQVRRMLAASFAHFWVILHDCRTNNLMGTGPVDARLEQKLDPEVDKLITLAEQLENAVKREREE